MVNVDNVFTNLVKHKYIMISYEVNKKPFKKMTG